MKRFSFLVMMVVSIFFIFDSQQAISATDCWVHIKVDPETNAPGHLDYCESGQSCDGVGINCEIISCDDFKKGLGESITGGTIITVNLAHGDYKVKNIDNTWTTVTRNGNNYHFTDRHYLIITNYSANTNLNNLRIELDGINTDSNGDFSVFVPNL